MDDQRVDRKGGSMNDQASEAVVVAVLAFLVLFFMNGNTINLPERFGLRRLLTWMTVIAVVLGSIAVLARIEH